MPIKHQNKLHYCLFLCKPSLSPHKKERESIAKSQSNYDIHDGSYLYIH